MDANPNFYDSVINNLNEIKNNYAFYVGLFGAITGGISLGINGYRAWREQAHVVINHVVPLNQSVLPFFSDITNFIIVSRRFSSPYRAIFHLEFINKSLSPITIYELELFIGLQKVSQYNQYMMIPSDYIYSYTETEAKILPVCSERLNMPLRLESFAMERGYVAFVLVGRITEQDERMRIVAKTSRGDFNTEINCKYFSALPIPEASRGRLIQQMQEIMQLSRAPIS